MHHHRDDRPGAPVEVRSLSEILADARDLQTRHAPRVLGTAASWLGERLAPRPGDQSSLVARRLVIH